MPKDFDVNAFINGLGAQFDAAQRSSGDGQLPRVTKPLTAGERQFLQTHTVNDIAPQPAAGQNLAEKIAVNVTVALAVEGIKVAVEGNKSSASAAPKKPQAKKLDEAVQKPAVSGQAPQSRPEPAKTPDKFCADVNLNPAPDCDPVPATPHAADTLASSTKMAQAVGGAEQGSYNNLKSVVSASANIGQGVLMDASEQQIQHTLSEQVELAKAKSNVAGQFAFKGAKLGAHGLFRASDYGKDPVSAAAQDLTDVIIKRAPVSSAASSALSKGSSVFFGVFGNADSAGLEPQFVVNESVDPNKPIAAITETGRYVPLAPLKPMPIVPPYNIFEAFKSQPLPEAVLQAPLPSLRRVPSTVFNIPFPGTGLNDGAADQSSKPAM